MSIDFCNHYQEMEMTCDQCNCAEANYSGSYIECINEAKSEGWQIKSVNNEWEHTCLECASEDPSANLEDRL